MIMRNFARKSDTKEQLTVATWLREIGLDFTLEEEFDPYIADIYIRALNLTIELDGPSHQEKRDSKRDEFLKETYEVDVWRFKNKQINTEFKSLFAGMIMERSEEFFNAQT